jgi:hypothetical protein
VVVTGGPVPIIRKHVRERRGDRCGGAFVCSHDLWAETARMRRAAAVRGWEIVGEMTTERWPATPA